MSNKTMTCRDVALRLQTYLDGELDAERMERIQTHLEACVDCGLEADVFTTIKNDLAKQVSPVNSEALARLRAFSDQIATAAQDEPQDH
ncbi:MAG: zf-HC2 domain-containing protein [Acidimicrobiia bacterium]|nr:zf-HC2 domain-containing protein [Acidimicrobiia bacterium]